MVIKMISPPEYVFFKEEDEEEYATNTSYRVETENAAINVEYFRCNVSGRDYMSIGPALFYDEEHKDSTKPIPILGLSAQEVDKLANHLEFMTWWNIQTLRIAK